MNCFNIPRTGSWRSAAGFLYRKVCDALPSHRHVGGRLAVGITCAVLVCSNACQASDPPLEDFGYGTMRTNRTQPLAIILVNFTNQGMPANISHPFPMGPGIADTNYAAAENYYSNWVVRVSKTNPSINGYLFEASNGRMGCSLAGITMLTLDTNCNYNGIAALVGGRNGTADAHYASNFLWWAASKPGFAGITNLDVNHNGNITNDECTLVLLSNDETVGGGARGPYNFPLPNSSLRWDGKFTFQNVNDAPLVVVNHEIIHVMQGGHSRDIYGKDEDLSDGYTIMGGGRDIVHPDPWHKLQLAWCEPRIQSLRESALLTLPAAQFMRSNAPVILYDPASAQRGFQEFFLLEYRTSTPASVGSGYDSGVAGNGLVIWHVQQDGNKNPIEYTVTYHPTAERSWARCSNCRGLFFMDGSNRPCPLGNTNHVAEATNLCLPYVSSAGGVPGWASCQKCSQLFYSPNVTSSACTAGGKHLAGVRDYRLRRDDDPEALGVRGWAPCSKCQSLCYGTGGTPGLCPSGGSHTITAGTPSYTVLWWPSMFAIMTAGSPDLARGRGEAWGGGTATPLLRWYDGTLSGTRIVVQPFAAEADEITIEIQSSYDTWVDFPYGGTEDGSFTFPFNTFVEGADAVYPGGILTIKTGTSSETRHVTKPMRIKSYGGSVTIGRP